MGNDAPNWKNLTSPSVAVFLQDYIKSALNTLIRAAYSKWRRVAKWHEPAFSQFVACDMPLQDPVGYPTAYWLRKDSARPRVHLERLVNVCQGWEQSVLNRIFCGGNVAQTPQAGYIWITSASLRFGLEQLRENIRKPTELICRP